MPVPTTFPTNIPTTVPTVGKQPGYAKKAKKLIFIVKTQGWQVTHWQDDPLTPPSPCGNVISAGDGDEDLTWGFLHLGKGVPARFLFTVVKNRHGVQIGALKRLAPGRVRTEQWRNATLQLKGCQVAPPAPTNDCRPTPTQRVQQPTNIPIPGGLPGTTTIRLSYVSNTDTFVFGLVPIKSIYTGGRATIFHCPFLQNIQSPPQDLISADPSTGAGQLVKQVPAARLAALKIGGYETFSIHYTSPTAHVYCARLVLPWDGTCASDVEIYAVVIIDRVK